MLALRRLLPLLLIVAGLATLALGLAWRAADRAPVAFPQAATAVLPAARMTDTAAPATRPALASALATATSTATLTPLPMFPTATGAAGSALATSAAVFASPASTPVDGMPGISLLPPPEPGAERWRYGLDLSHVGADKQPLLVQLGATWYASWWMRSDAPGPGEYWQMVHFYADGTETPAEDFSALARARPGQYWIIGNEPDVVQQDNLTPEQYAAGYHAMYTRLKAADPTCKIVIAGVAQATALRLAYLDRVLAYYRATYQRNLPVDVWNVHNYLLREERDSWGAGIPPGFDDRQGALYEIDDSGNVEAFKRQLVAFRLWMAERGYRDTPLVVTEFGIPMPPDYGFPPQRVERFLRDTWDFMLRASSADTGYPGDANRLVQRWAWFSLGDGEYPSGNLADPQTFEITPLGRVFAELARR